MEEKFLQPKDTIEDEELVLLILYFSENNFTSKTRLIKLLFVIEKIFQINKESDLCLEFFPYNYGPTISNDEYELLISTLKNYNLIKVEEKFHQKYSTKIYLIKMLEDNKENIIKSIEENLIPVIPIYKTELISKISKIFPNYENQESLLQFVYYFGEYYTTKSLIKDEIFNLPKENLQYKIIRLYEELRVRYLDVFSNYTEPILRSFNITEKTPDYYNIKKLLDVLHSGIKNNHLIITKKIVNNLDQISLKKKNLHKLKLSLLNIFLENLEKVWDNETIISILIYILRSLSLHWPLELQRERNDFVSFTSQIYQDINSFYMPEDTFMVIEKKPASEEELELYISKYNINLTKEDLMNEETLEYASDSTEDDEDEETLNQLTNT